MLLLLPPPPAPRIEDRLGEADCRVASSRGDVTVELGVFDMEEADAGSCLMLV